MKALKKVKTIAALLLSLVMMAAVFTGCTSRQGETEGTKNETAEKAGTEKGTETADTEASDETKEGGMNLNGLVLPLTEEKAELSVWLNYSGSVITDMNEIEGIKKAEEMTGVHINWIPVEQQQGGEKFGILLASGEYPDIIDYSDYPGGIEKGISDGVIREDMEELIDKYMPNYKKYLEENELAKKQATADNGRKLTLRIIVGEDFNCKSEGTYYGLCYRKDLLEGLGIEEPKTVDEWHDALVKAKESGINTPFMLYSNGGSNLSLSWGVDTVTEYLQVDGDKVVGVALEDGFGEYLDTMRQWYAEGLIDPNFTSFNFYASTPGAVENNEHLLYSFVLSVFTGNNYYSMHMVNNESEYLQPIVAPALKEGDVPIQSGNRVEAKDYCFITTSCKNPELAAKWLDFWYSKEGELLNWYGIEGETYTMENGIPQFTEMVLNNPDGKPASTVLEKYALGWGNAWIGKHNTLASEKIATAAAGGMNQQKAAVDIWSSPEKNIFIPRGITLTEEETDKISTKMASVKTLIEEHMINYIIGTDDTSFEDFKAQLVQYGYEEVIAIYQAGLDRYNNR